MNQVPDHTSSRCTKQGKKGEGEGIEVASGGTPSRTRAHDGHWHGILAGFETCIGDRTPVHTTIHNVKYHEPLAHRKQFILRKSCI